MVERLVLKAFFIVMSSRPGKTHKSRVAMPNVTCPSIGVLKDLLVSEGINVPIESNPDIAGFRVIKPTSPP